MRIIQNDEDRILEIWLSNPEQKDPSVKNSLMPLIKSMKARKYLVCIYESGSQDVFKQTEALLLSNYKKIRSSADRER